MNVREYFVELFVAAGRLQYTKDEVGYASKRLAPHTSPSSVKLRRAGGVGLRKGRRTILHRAGIDKRQRSHQYSVYISFV